MPVTFDELVGSPHYNGSMTELTGVRRGLIDWSDIDAFYLELFPAAVSGIPQLPALMPGSSVLYAEGVSFRPQHDDKDPTNSCSTSAINQHDKALVEVTYKTYPYTQADPNNDQIISYQFGIGGEFLTYRNQGIRWKGEVDPIKDTEIAAGKIIPTEEFSIRLHRVTPAYYSTLRGLCRSLVGKTNNATFEGAPTETLLFLGANFQQTVTAGGSSPWEVELRFSERIAKNGSQQVGWNYLFDEAQGEWREVETTNGDKIYPTGNFNQFY